MTIAQWVAFWPWFWTDGLRSFVRTPADRGILLLHGIVGAVLAKAVTDPLSKIAVAALAPFGAILFGLTFAWSGTFASLVQTDNMRRIGKKRNGNLFRAWVMGYQLALLVVLAVTVLWSVIGMGTFDRAAHHVPTWVRLAFRGIAFALASVAVRESWSGAATIHSILLHSEVLTRHAESAEAAVQGIDAEPTAQHVEGGPRVDPHVAANDHTSPESQVEASTTAAGRSRESS